MDKKMTPKNVRFIRVDISNLTSIDRFQSALKKYLQLCSYIENIIYDNPYNVHHGRVDIVLDDGKRYNMSIGHFYINLLFWCFNVCFGLKITSKDLVSLHEVDGGIFSKIMDGKIRQFSDAGYNVSSFPIVSKIKNKLIDLGKFYGRFVANTFSLYDVICLRNRRKDFNVLLNSQISNDMTMAEVETFIAESRDRLFNIIKEDKGSGLYPFIATKSLKALQVGQLFLPVGNSIDIDKTILPISITRGWIHGLKNVKEVYASAVAARSSAITKKDAVPKSGYLSRRLLIANKRSTTNNRIFDCGSKHYLDIFVENKDVLKSLVGKYYLNPDNKLESISIKDDHLIGQNIQIRTITKCITNHSINEICCVCLGERYKTLKNSRIGGLVNIMIATPLTKLGLSAKHAQAVKPEDVSDGDIEKWFQFTKSDVFMNSDFKKEQGCKILIPIEDIVDIIQNGSNNSGDDNDEGGGSVREIEKIFIRNNQTINILSLMDKSFDLSFSDEFIRVIKKKMRSTGTFRVDAKDDFIIKCDEMLDINNQNIGDIEFLEIGMNDIKFENPVFSYKLVTEEVSKYLKLIERIIDSKLTYSFNSVEEMISEIIKALSQSETLKEGEMIYIETLVANLMRNAEKDVERPNFALVREPKYTILTLKKAIKRSDLFSGAIFEHNKTEYVLPETLHKTQSGCYDVFFSNEEIEQNSKFLRKTRPYLFEKE
jgi:hypothetical protein